ncbi:MAG: YeeE/YedE family protein, partial [Turicibacter sp.]|nr:YeeE/YedE family protein [Turicibacter sp.]
MVQMVITGLLVGGVLGLVLQRGRFCFTGAFRDVLISKDSLILKALLLSIAVHAIGILALSGLDIISPNVGQFSGVAVIAGGFIFGLGIIM